MFDSTAVAQTVAYRKAQANQLLEQGNQEFEISNFNKALQFWKQSLNIYQEMRDRQGEAVSLGNLGLVYHELGDYRTAIDYYGKSLNISRQIRDRRGEAASLNNLGSTYASLGDYNTAIGFYEKSLAIAKQIKDSQSEAISLGNLGYTYASLGNYKKASFYQKQSQEQALAVVSNSGKVISIASQRQSQSGNGSQIQSQQQSVAVTSSSGTAITTVSQGQSQQRSTAVTSISISSEAVAISSPQQSIAVAGNSSQAIAIIYRQQNRNIYQQQFLAIVGDHDEAIDYFKKSLEFNQKNRNKQGEAASLIGLGNAYLQKGYHNTAINYARKSLALTKRIGDKQGEAASLIGLGNAYFQKGDYNKSIDSFKQSLNIYLKIGNRKGEAVSQENLGKAYLQKLEYDKAVHFFQISLEITKKIGYRQGKASSLNNLGKALFLSGKFADAEKYLNEAINSWEAIRELLGNQDTWKISIFEQQAETYRLLQQVLVAQQRPQDALLTSEQGRNRALVEILIRRRSEKPDNLLTPPRPTITKLRQIAIEQNATLVEYSVTPDEIFIWVIPPHQGEIKFHSSKLTNNISLKELVKASRESIGIRGRGSNNSTSQTNSSNSRLRQLHKLLIEPIASFLPTDEQQRVIFIPHQELFLVPFVALLDNKNQYLIEKHTILTAPSIEALGLTQTDKQTQKNSNLFVLPFGKEVLIVGNPTMPKLKVGKELEPLEGAEREAEIIAKKLGTTAIIRDGATESAIVQKMASARLIHLATHGLLDGINAIGSPGAIALAPSGKDDGFLTTSEIMERFGLPGKSPLQAELVVLSACDTGRGDIKGEGVVGLSRAFMASGVPTLVVSLWKVPDDDTVKLMTEFYNNLYERKFDKAKAMREAMLTTLRDVEPDSKAWAAFTVIGKAD
ncbi:hypothetical protein NUACC21_55190 [Scytonema sp. NUACC21]